MKRLFPVLLILFLSFFLFSCATTEKPRAEIEGEITLIGGTPGLDVEIKIPLKSETEETKPIEDSTLVEEPTTIEDSSFVEENSNEEDYSQVEEPIIPNSVEETPTTIEETSDVPSEEIVTEKEENTEDLPSITIIGGADTPSDIYITANEEPAPSFTPIDMDDLISLFNYAYGLKTMDDIKAESIPLNAQYFARGVLDAVSSPIPVLVSTVEIQNTIDQFVLEYYYEGKTFEPGNRPNSLDDLLNLPSPSNLEEAFSYAYTFSLIRELVDGEVDVRAESFILGGLDSLYDEERLLDGTGIDDAINNYINYLNEEYLKELENKGENNLAKAKEFLERNGREEGVITLNSGIQLMILDEDDTLGSNPTQYDTVIVDYNMYVMDYETEDLEIIDADYWAELRLIEVDTALQSSIVALKVGQAGRTWIPPELLYGNRNIEGIEPNSIIVYDIALHDII